MEDTFVPLEPSLERSSNEHTIDCFESCINGFYKNNQGEKVQISDMIQNCLANTKSYPPDFQFEIQPITSPCKGEIEIRYESTLHGIYRMSIEEHKTNIGVLNFASGFHPGGGVLRGSNAQEESLCRCSALYYSEIQKPDFYEYHRENCDRIASNYMIFSPDCPTWKVDNYEVLDQPILVSYITSAAVNNRAFNYDPDEIKDIHDERIKLILYCAIQNGVKNLILGAYGCGAFHNRPEDIANSFKHWLIDENLKNYFETISFSIIERIDTKVDGKVKNSDVFCNIFNLPLIKKMIIINIMFDEKLINMLHLQKKEFDFDIPYGTKTGYLPSVINSELIHVDDHNDFYFIFHNGVLNRNIQYLYNGGDINILGFEIFIQNNDSIEFIYDENSNGRYEKHRGGYKQKKYRKGNKYHHQGFH